MKNSKTLLGISLLGAILVSFGLILVKTDVTMAEDNHFYSEFNYVGIENVTENVYSISFWDKNTMFVTGGDDSIFHMSKIPVIIKSVHNAINGSISNILGGNHVNIGKSHNITVIGGKGIVKDGNTNATLFGGYENEIQYNTSLDTPTVLLGGKSNVVETGHDANVIVGGSSNTIRQGAQNVNILGGTDIFIDGNDVVAAGQKISGDVSDSFVFSDGIYNGIINLEGSGMFLLKVSNGVGFGTGTQDGNQGVASNGAISVGSININSVDCTESIPENVGLFGAWNGCLVGCTSGSAMVSKWEMLGYGDYCEQLCNSSDKCIAHPIDSWDIDYPSFCTAGFVDTSNASLCPGLSLEPYHNVIFETYLIDSEEECPSSSAVYNQCAFRCNEHAHLTGDKTGKMDGDTKCFNDCLLPWSESQYRGHNEIITGYALTGVDCYDGAGVHDTCEPYRSNLMCVNGKRYEMENGIVTDTENTDYIYETCTLHSYTCDEEFNLTRENIVNDKKDFVEVWRYGNTNSLLSDFILNKIINPHLGYVQYSDIERNADEPTQEPGNMQMGVRGKYTLCIQYVPETTPANQYPGNEQACVESSPLPEQYRYKFEECNEGYELAEDGVCRKLCEYDGKLIQHGSGIVLYSGSYATCPSTCEENSKQFICYDGTLYADLQVGENGGFTSGVAQNSTPYTQTGCTVECPQCGPANGKEYETLPTLEYILCTGSTLSGGVTTTETEFTWTCMTGHSSVNCSAIHGNNFTYEDLDIYFLTDEGNIGNYTLMDRNLGATAYMGEPGKSTGDWYGDYYQWGNNYGFPNYGDVDITTEKADVLGYGPGEYLNNSFYVYNGSPSLPEGNWFIEPNYDLWGNVTDTVDARQGPCPDEYHVPTSDEFVNLIYDWGEYGYDISRDEYCTSLGTPSGFLYGPTWSSDLLMPFGGNRWTDSSIRGQGQFGYLQTSSIFGGPSRNSSYLYYSTLGDCVNVVGTYGGGTVNSVSYGKPVRCIKNSPNQLLTIDAKEGTGALIIVHGNTITKLGTPHKGNMIFEGWYSDSSFTPSSKVITGNTVSAGTHLYAKWGCTDGYYMSGDTCLPNEIINQCEINSSNFEDLDMYFITDAGTQGHYTLMDRNLGATAYMNETGKTTGDWYGCYYQWGNNYGFPNQGTVNTSTTQVDVLVYGSGNYYSSGTFITRSSSPYGWTITANANLWGGNGSELDRQGPCPDEYHVPTKDEFVSIVNNYWTKSVDNNGSDQRSSDSLMPFAGYRYFASASVYAPYGYYGDYWSSTSDTSIGANCLHLNSIADPLPKYSYINSYGFSLRCFKNSPTQSLTLHPNGGTGALIILHGNEITKLGTPHKGNMIFEGWYSNQSFTPSSKVITGNTVSAGTHLYAKWGCAEGYVQSGDNCVVVYNCGGETPHGDNVLMGASTGSIQKLWTYKAEGDLGECEWRCHEGYVQSGNTCEIVPSYECVSNDYMFNTGSVVQIVGILPTSIGDVEKQLFASEDAIPNGQACAYVCNEAEGYHYFPDGGGICAKCEDGTESEVNGQLVCTKIIDVCPNPDEYAYVPETHTCEPYGNCTRAGQVKQGVIPVNSNITNLNSARPIGTSLMEWSCADDYYYTTYDISGLRRMSQSLSNELIDYVQNSHNQCIYTCPSGSQCRSPFNDNIVGCAQDVHCEDWYPEYREYALTGENDPYRDAQSVGGAFGTEYKATRRSYLDSVTDAGDFYDEVERNPGVCWFWCPESHLCRLDPSTHQPTYDQNIWQCYETEDDRDANCIEGAPSNTQSYVCTTGGRKVNGSDYTLGGYSQFSRYAKGQNREFQTFAVQNGIAGHLSEGCYQGCTALAESGVVNYNGSQICWKQCSENQYFDVGTGQGCKSCANPSKKPNPDDVFLGNAMSCVDKCPAGSVRGPDYGHDGGEGCRFSVDAGSCPPDLETRIYDPGDGHLICVRDMSS